MRAGYWTAKRLAELDIQLSDLDRRILDDVARFRLISGDQLRRLHMADFHRRSALRHLTHLVHEQVLARLDRQVGGVRSGSSGFVYFLGPAGSRLLAWSVGRRSWTPSTVFQRHTLGIAERYVQLVEESARRHGTAIQTFEAEPDCWRTFVGSAGQSLILKPDGYFILRAPSFDEHWFLEVDFATHSLSAIRRKALVYSNYLASGREQERLGVFPRVWWWTPNDNRADALRRTLSETPFAQMHTVCATDRAIWSPLSVDGESHNVVDSTDDRSGRSL